MSRYVLALLLVAAVSVIGAGARAAAQANGAAPARRASQGVYTKAQARRGASVFEDVCVACHTLGRFRGPDFATKWGDKPLAALYKAVKTMPQGEPESLDPQDYADVVGYFLSVNAYPEGAQELAPSDEAVAAIWLDAKAP